MVSIASNQRARLINKELVRLGLDPTVDRRLGVTAVASRSGEVRLMDDCGEESYWSFMVLKHLQNSKVGDHSLDVNDENSFWILVSKFIRS